MYWIARAVGVIGAVAFAAGLATVVTSGSAFPSRMTCVTDYDTIMCNIEPWPAALWLVIAGGLVIALAYSILIRRSD
jgi:hypothetical protein